MSEDRGEIDQVAQRVTHVGRGATLRQLPVEPEIGSLQDVLRRGLMAGF